MTLWERLKDVMRKIKADNGNGLSVTVVGESISVMKDIKEQGPTGATQTRIQRIVLTAEEVQWLSNQFTRIFAEEEPRG